MDNPIYFNRDDMAFIENNYEELSNSIGLEKHSSEYYIGSFKYPECGFNLGAALYQGMWFGYRKMYLISFIVGFITVLIPFVAIFLGVLLISRGDIVNIIKGLMSPSVLGYYFALYKIASKMSILIPIGVAVTFICIFLLGQYANYIYFKSLKKRVIHRKEKKYGKSKLGILYGFLLGTLGQLLALSTVGILILYLKALAEK